jgi:hypothetical protein
VSNETPLKYRTVYYYFELDVGIVAAQMIDSKGSALMLNLRSYDFIEGLATKISAKSSP